VFRGGRGREGGRRRERKGGREGERERERGRGREREGERERERGRGREGEGGSEGRREGGRYTFWGLGFRVQFCAMQTATSSVMTSLLSIENTLYIYRESTFYACIITHFRLSIENTFYLSVQTCGPMQTATSSTKTQSGCSTAPGITSIVCTRDSSAFMYA